MTQRSDAVGLLADINKAALEAERVERKARLAADLIISRECSEIPRDAVTLLCEMTADENPEVAQAGLRNLFPALIERLNDSFDPSACGLYDQIFAQVIDFYRRLRRAKDLDYALRGFGILNESDLLNRKSNVVFRDWPLSPTRIGSDGRDPEKILKVLLLSRVTIGADVAVTSVIMSRLRSLLPKAEFTLLGSAKLRDLFGGDSRIRIREIKYERGGGVLSRLMSWIDLAGEVNEEITGLRSNEFLLIDHDSRLTQLGMLPVLKDERNYFFFESRSYQGPDGESRNPRTLGWLASSWATEVFGGTGDTFPYLSIPSEYLDFGRSIIEKLRRRGASRVTVVSFGVGGNQNKRVSEEFEIETVNRLIEESTIILDKGSTEEERLQIDRIVARLRLAGRVVVEIKEKDRSKMLSSEKIEADLLTWDGSLGAFAGLIAASDRYVGYDSAGQHIAAALGVPTMAIFTKPDSPLFAERWRPYGPGTVEVVEVEKKLSAE